MKITLRKANALQNAINDAIKSLDLVDEISLNEFEDVNEQIQTARNRFFENNAKREKLLSVLYTIRKKVATANEVSGINNLLVNLAYAEKLIKFNQLLIAKGSQKPLRVLNGHLSKLREAKDDIYNYSRGAVTTVIFTEEEIELLRLTINNNKNEKQYTQDKLLELNIKTEIELDIKDDDLKEVFDIIGFW